MSVRIVKTIIFTEVGALPYGENTRNKLVIESGVKRTPKEFNDAYQAETIGSWFMRYVPAQLYDALFGGKS